MRKKGYESSPKGPVAIARRPFETSPPDVLELGVESVTDPEIAAYIEFLKKEYRTYSMPIDEARKVVDAAMGKRTLTGLLYEARGQA